MIYMVQSQIIWWNILSIVSQDLVRQYTAGSVVVGEMIKQKKTIECNKKYKKMYNAK